MASQELRWYFVHVDFGPGVQPWLTSIKASSPEDAREQLARSFAAEGVVATIGEVGLIADLPLSAEESAREEDEAADREAHDANERSRQLAAEMAEEDVS